MKVQSILSAIPVSFQRLVYVPFESTGTVVCEKPEAF